MSEHEEKKSNRNYEQPIYILHKDDYENGNLNEQYQSLLSEKKTLDEQLVRLRKDLDKALLLSNSNEGGGEDSLLIAQLLEVQLALEETILERDSLKKINADTATSYALLHKRLLRVSATNQSRQIELMKQQQHFESFKEEQEKKERELVIKLFSICQENNVLLNKQSATEFEVEREEIASSDFFDEIWYMAQYKDIADSEVNPITHYLVRGVCEGRNPSPKFDTVLYLMRYPDVLEKGVNPLIHYIRHGINEGRVAL